MSVRHRDIRMAMERLALMKAKLEQADKGFQQVGYPSAAHAQAFVAYRLLDVVNEAADKFWTLVEEDRVEKDSDTEDATNDNWLTQEFARARARASQLPNFARPELRETRSPLD